RTDPVDLSSPAGRGLCEKFPKWIDFPFAGRRIAGHGGEVGSPAGSGRPACRPPEAPMFGDFIDRKELGRYLALAQVGLEMVVPIGVGLALDNYLGWSPWGVIGGAVLGLVGGLAHLVHLAGKADPGPSAPHPPG